QSDERVVKRANGSTNLRKHGRLIPKDVVVMIPTAPLDKKRLADGAKSCASLDGARNHGQPIPDVSVRKTDSVRQGRRAGGGESLISIEGLPFSGVESLGQKIGVLLRQLTVD